MPAIGIAHLQAMGGHSVQRRIVDSVIFRDSLQKLGWSSWATASCGGYQGRFQQPFFKVMLRFGIHFLHSTLKVGRRVLGVGRWVLGVGRWVFDAGSSTFSFPSFLHS